MIDHFLGDAFGVLSYQFWSTILQSGARLPIHTLNYWTVQSVEPGFKLGVCLSVILLIVDPWQPGVCFIRPGVTQCTLLMMLCLDRMCQCRLQAVLWSHIGTLMHRIAAKPRSTAGLFPSQCPSGMILLDHSRGTLYTRLYGTGGFQEHGQCFFIDLSCSSPTIVFYYFSFSLLSV